MPTAATNTSGLTRRRRRRGGFTLVEILVVIGIIVLLAGILVPLVGRAMRQAKQTRTAADLQSIATAIEAFKTDHGYYPGAEPTIAENTGAAMLGRYLNGPLGDGFLPGSTSTTPDDPNDPPAYSGAKEYGAGDAVAVGQDVYVALVPNSGVAPTSDPKVWAQRNLLRDGLDGPGYRMRAGGKKFGPYIDAGSMKMRGVAFIDGNGNPVLYFLANPAKINVTDQATGGGWYVARSSVDGGKANMKYDAEDNFEPFRRPGEADTGQNVSPLHRIRAMLGDYDGDGRIETSQGEKVVTEAPYLLWAAGTDGKFGPDADAAKEANILDVHDVDKCDDVTNFK